MPINCSARVTCHQFNQLPVKDQLAAALHHGTYLATRRQSAKEAINLYALHGFYAEVVYDTAANELLGLRSFSEQDGLEDYTGSVRLPDWLSTGEYF